MNDTTPIQEVEQAKAIAQYSQQQQAEKEDLIRYQLEPKEILTEMMWLWQGFKEGEEGYLKDPNMIPLINSKGANALYSWIYPILSKLTTLSNMDEDTVKQNTVRFMDTLSFFLIKNKEAFAIINNQAVDSMIEVCGDLYYAAGMKSYNAGERDSIRKQYILSDSRQVLTEKPNEEKSFNVFRMFK
jgi:hypothetical protein